MSAGGEAAALFFSVAIIVSRASAFLNTHAFVACPTKVAAFLNKFPITILEAQEKVNRNNLKINRSF